LVNLNNIRPYREWSPKFDQTVYIDQSAQLVGNITIGSNSSIWPLVAARGDVNYITIGACTNIQDSSVLHVARGSDQNPDGFGLIIGDEVTVGHGAILHACQVGHRSLIGMGATILDGAVLEDDILLAAGSLVPPGKVLDGGYLWRGSPAKKIRRLTADETNWIVESALHYIQLKNEYLELAQ
jgi:carbonic anhydrase/acetyltransferase-like protein (isoleucine patch superfamily)